MDLGAPTIVILLSRALSSHVPPAFSYSMRVRKADMPTVSGISKLFKNTLGVESACSCFTTQASSTKTYMETVVLLRKHCFARPKSL